MRLIKPVNIFFLAILFNGLFPISQPPRAAHSGDFSGNVQYGPQIPIGNGKFGDLLMLDRDYFSVSDADMRRTQPVMAVVAGKIVHDAEALEKPKAG